MVQIPNAQRLGDMPSGEPIPEGVYHIRCDKAEFKTSKANPAKGKPGGVPMVETTWTVFGPQEQEEFHGRKLFENLMLDGEGRFRLRQVLEAAGYDDDFVLEDTEQLLNLECAVVVQVEKERPDPDNPGKTFPERNKIQRWMPLE